MNTERDYGIALLRITLGALMLFHGLVKIFVFTPAGTVGFFASLGLPAPLAYLTILIEAGGGLALILGLFTRWNALVQAAVLVGTIVTVHGARGFGFSNPGGGWEYPAMWAITLVALSFMGNGALALNIGALNLGARKA
jgi:putative oxidoreductase